MGKPAGKKKGGGTPPESSPRATMNRSKTMAASAGRPATVDRSKSTAAAAFDEDTAIFINLSQELKEEGNRLFFQRKDHEGAMLKYEKALKLLPKNHIDVAYLRSNMAACYMQMGLGEYPRAISECNLALEVSPKYSKALLRRAKCYEALNRLDLAWRDVNFVLSMEPNNLTALEVLGSVKNAMEEKGISFDEKVKNSEEKGVSFDEKDKNSEEKGVSFDEKVKNSEEKGVSFDEKVKDSMEEKGVSFGEKVIGLDGMEGAGEDEKGASRFRKVVKDGIKKKKKKSGKEKEKKEERRDKERKEERRDKERREKRKEKEREKGQEKEEGMEKEKETEKEKEKEEEKVVVVEKEVKDKEVVLDYVKKDGESEKAVSRSVKLVLGDDIRWAQLPTNCGVGLLMDVVRDRFPGLKGVLVKYKDQEGDLITITSTDELRLAESSGPSQGSLRFYVVEVGHSREPAYEGKKIDKGVGLDMTKVEEVVENGKETSKELEVGKKVPCIEDWIFQFARLFKNHVGIDSDSYLDLHELGVKLYSEALEDAVTSDDAQELFDIAVDKFQEMAALALFNWGNVHLSKARKRIFFSEDGSIDTVLAQVKTGYEWAKAEYAKAGSRYHEALKIKPDFCEGLLALGQQQFEQAKLCWYHAIGSDIDIESGPSEEVLDLYNKAEDCMEKGVQMWEEMEEQRLNGLSKIETYKSQLQKMGLDGLLKELSPEEAAEQAANMSSQIHLLWGTMLYERSLVEFRLELPTWEECLDVAIEKFELAGASPTDIAVMIKNHASNETALDGLGFKIDEIVQAWNEMYDAKRWETGVPSFRLEPLFRRRVPKLHAMLEHVGL